MCDNGASTQANNRYSAGCDFGTWCLRQNSDRHMIDCPKRQITTTFGINSFLPYRDCDVLVPIVEMLHLDNEVLTKQNMHLFCVLIYLEYSIGNNEKYMHPPFPTATTLKDRS